jgi:hypothetical protein
MWRHEPESFIRELAFTEARYWDCDASHKLNN